MLTFFAIIVDRMLKKCGLYIGVLFLGVILCAESFSATLNASSRVEILEPLVLLELEPLDFGAIIKGDSDTTVRLNPDGSIDETSQSYSFFGQARPGVISISGRKNSFISVRVASGSLNGVLSSIALKEFKHDAGETPQLDSQGNLLVNIGAAIDIAQNQAAGIYEGVYSVTVDYP